MAQEQSRRPAGHEPADSEPIHRTPPNQKTNDLDDILGGVLDEIDSVLEADAETFMSRYVQGNGQ